MTNEEITPTNNRKEVPHQKYTKDFLFDGGAANYWATYLLGLLITIITVGICYPFALVLIEKWRAKHTYIRGRQLEFKGSAIGLFFNWIKWFLFCIITLGIYSLWLIPKIQKWKTENTYIKR